jgi:hypothetical protein
MKMEILIIQKQLKKKSDAPEAKEPCPLNELLDQGEASPMLHAFVAEDDRAHDRITLEVADKEKISQKGDDRTFIIGTVPGPEVQQQIKSKEEIKSHMDLLEKIKCATDKYLEWRNEHAPGRRFLSHFGHIWHGRDGIVRAERLKSAVDKVLDDIEQNKENYSADTIINLATNISSAAVICFRRSGSCQHSFSRFLYQELSGIECVDNPLYKDRVFNAIKQDAITNHNLIAPTRRR